MPAPQWSLSQPDPDAVAALQASGLPSLLARLLALRGVTQASAAAFLQPQLRDLPDPWTMADCQTACETIAAAMRAGTAICVYGDYDVDGVTAAALLSEAFGQLGYAVEVFLPDRLRDGYGLHPARLAELADRGIGLFISVDCGCTATAEIAAMRARGCDFVVVDHHALGPRLPPATAVLNPKRSDCAYPDKQLSAVGVALVLVQGLRRTLASVGWPQAAALDLKELLELAALGTIADQVELRGVNRTLAWHGLRRLGQTRRPGLQALARHLPQGGTAADRVGFHLGPRINAAGRVAEARTAFALLTERDAATAEDLALRLDIENNRRKDLQAQVVAEALAQAATHDRTADAVVVAGKGWHPGVVGIVAARVREQFGVPALVLAVDDDGVARGSGRSVSGYDLVEALRAIDQVDGGTLMERFGGHAFAAGMTLRADRLEQLRLRLADHAAAHWPAELRHPPLQIDAEVTIDEIDLALVDQLDQLEPFGKGNRAPLLLIRDVEVAGLQRVGKSADWARAKLHARGRQPLWARPHLAAFSAAALWQGVSSGDHIDVVVRLERNHFNGRTTLQGTVEALRPADRAGDDPVDTRVLLPAHGAVVA